MKLTILLAVLFIIGVALDGNPEIAAEAKRIKARAPIFCAPSFDPDKMDAANAPIFQGLGNLHCKVTTTSPKAQQYFNQGLTLVYAFNHGEAGRSFKAAIEADPTCAMAYWGLGMVLGPNYNAALDPSILSNIHDVMKKAMAYSANVSEREKAMIEALSKRFPAAAVQDMTPYNAAYAAAMKKVYEQYPNDADIAAVYADALMNEHPWNLWLKDGTAQPWTPAILEVLEKLLKQWPNHPGANHMYIHAVEASKQASKGLPSARKLSTLLPAAGHLLHMPSHIYIRTGHYHEGVLANERSSAADSSYISQCKVQGVYPMMYYPHNVHFLAACAFMEGNSKKALAAAWRVSGLADKRYLHESVSVQHFYSIPYYVMVHLGKWKDILALPMPGESLKYPRAVWHYARGMAYAAGGDLGNAEKELKELSVIAADASLKTMLIWEMNSAADLVQIAFKVLGGEIAARHGQHDRAVELLREAVAIETSLTYQEPPDWFFSVRHTLGHILVKSGNYAEAEKVYREDLETFPENGWSLIGLYNSLAGQGRMQEAKEAKKRFDNAWQYADIKITSSRIE